MKCLFTVWLPRFILWLLYCYLPGKTQVANSSAFSYWKLLDFLFYYYLQFAGVIKQTCNSNYC